VFSDFSDTAFNAREAMAKGVWPAVEYLLPGATRYFRTTNQAELAVVAANRVGAWDLTGDIFNVWISQADNAGAVPVCRIFNTNGSRHLYSAVASECAAWKTQAGAVDEGVAFYAVVPNAGACPANTKPVDRLRMTNAGLVYERYVASATESAALVAKGWTKVGIGLCAAS
jgi:hypothetical protein